MTALHYHYLIVGGGMTADAAARGIRSVDKQGTIGLISGETQGPYDRPPLSKGLWKGKPIEKIRRGTERLGVDLHLGREVEALEPGTKLVTDDQGTQYSYDKLLLATGGSPRHVPGTDPHDVIYFRTLGSYEALRALSAGHDRFAVAGGGFIGSELAAALAMQGKHVTMIFPGSCIGERIYPADLAQFVTDYYREKGVEVLSGHSLAHVTRRSDEQVVVTARSTTGGADQTVSAAAVVAGLGIVPNVRLAKSAGLQVEDGILVDPALRTSQPDIYAAGDVANFYNPALDTRLRVEHEDNANSMGSAAGKSMAGEPVSYTHLPFFYSDLFDLGYEAVGLTDPRLETFEDWQEPFRKGVVYYLHDGRVRGVLLWNVWEQVDNARKLIAEPGPFNAQRLKGRLPA